MNRARTSLLRAGVFVLGLFLSGYLCPSAMGQAAIEGRWNTLPYLMPINPVHEALMNNGKVLIVSGSGNVPLNTDFRAGVWDPRTGTITTQAVGWDMFCNGMVVLADGRVFVNGGNLQYDPFQGEPRSSLYDPAAGQFTMDLPNMAHGRWYPTVTMLGDGRVMTFSGLTETSATNTTVEIYTAGSGWSQEYAAPWTPPLYPRMHLLPDGTVFYSGSSTDSKIFDPSTKAWSTVAYTNYSGDRVYGTSVLLPLTPANGYKPAVMIFGGGNPATATTEIIDLSAPTPAWRHGPPMSQPRIEMNATLLPNGKVLATGGSAYDEDAATASLNADLYDPQTDTFSSAGANAFPRLYHSNSLLLPDGTVLLAGGNPHRGSFEQHMEIYSPAYLFNADGSLATRPAITGVTPAAAIGYGGSLQVQTPDAASITSAVLMRPGAPTHAFDMEQRLVGLSYTVGSGVLNVTAPPNGNIAPPGYYMLFILNSAGVPSVASFVRLSGKPPTATITLPASDVTVNPGQSVFFSGTGSDPDGSITAYSWSFPGGQPGSSSLATPGQVTYSTPGTYVASLTVTDNAGLTNQSPATRSISVPDFSVSATPASQTVLPGGSTSYTVTVTPGTGFTAPVTFSVSGLPSGATASFNPASVSGSGSTTMLVSSSLLTPLGSYPLTVSGYSGGLAHSVTVTLVVGPPPLVMR